MMREEIKAFFLILQWIIELEWNTLLKFNICWIPIFVGFFVETIHKITCSFKCNFYYILYWEDHWNPWNCNFHQIHVNWCQRINRSKVLTRINLALKIHIPIFGKQVLKNGTLYHSQYQKQVIKCCIWHLMFVDHTIGTFVK